MLSPQNKDPSSLLGDSPRAEEQSQKNGLQLVWPIRCVTLDNSLARLRVISLTLEKERACLDLTVVD